MHLENQFPPDVIGVAPPDHFAQEGDANHGCVVFSFFPELGYDSLGGSSLMNISSLLSTNLLKDRLFPR